MGKASFIYIKPAELGRPEHIKINSKSATNSILNKILIDPRGILYLQGFLTQVIADKESVSDCKRLRLHKTTDITDYKKKDGLPVTGIEITEATLKGYTCVANLSSRRQELLTSGGLMRTLHLPL
ncbi:UNVERIFIED_CONTAM: hypothetical protein FKN15_004801 [Acipenser sinensis]